MSCDGGSVLGQFAGPAGVGGAVRGRVTQRAGRARSAFKHDLKCSATVPIECDAPMREKRARQRSSELATKLLISNIGKQGCRPVSSARPPFLDRAGQEQPLGGRRATGSDSNDATASKAAHLRSRRAAEAAIASSGQMARCSRTRSESVVSYPFGTRSTPSRSAGAVP